jgi:hypothetical protein
MTELLAIHHTRTAALAIRLSDSINLDADDPTTADDEDPQDRDHHLSPAT